MRRINQFFYVLMTVAAISFTACSSDDDNNGGGNNAAAGTITAKINGADFDSLELTTIATSAAGNMIIQGNQADGKSIIMSIFGYNGPGTYEFSGVDPLILHIASYIEADANNPMNTQTWSAPYDSTLSGTVTITEETSDNLKGTFEFTGQNANDMTTVAVTEGSFDVALQIL